MSTAAVVKGDHGKNVTRWRNWRDMKIEELASRIEVSPETLLEYEQQDIIEQEILEKLAKELNIPVAAITELGDDTAISIVANNFHNSSSALQYRCTIGSTDKIIELYEKLLEAEKQKVSLLQEALNERGKY